MGSGWSFLVDMDRHASFTGRWKGREKPFFKNQIDEPERSCENT